MNKHLQTVFDKPMNRKEFLGYIAAAVLAVVGVSGMIKAMLHHDGGSAPNRGGLADGYGASGYGGVVKKSFLS